MLWYAEHESEAVFTLIGGIILKTLLNHNEVEDIT